MGIAHEILHSIWSIFQPTNRHKTDRTVHVCDHPSFTVSRQSYALSYRELGRDVIGKRLLMSETWVLWDRMITLTGIRFLVDATVSDHL